jgi:monomeric sarcosine oxidase
MQRYRYAVIGGGGIGSAAAYWLSRHAGDGVVCLEQWELGHRMGASEDHSRIIRLGYHSSTYTALTRDAYAAWRIVEEESGVPLVHTTGMVNIAQPGTEGGEILDAYVAAMDEHDIAYERLDSHELTRRWPQFRLPDDHEALFQPDGGILDIRRAGAAHVALARARGATVLPNAGVTAIRAASGGVELVTRAGAVHAEKVVICAGAWTAGLLTRLGLDWPIRLTQEQVTYYATPNLSDFAPERFPVWIWHGGLEETFYGLPVYGVPGTKAGQDVGGDVVTVDTRTFDPNPRILAYLRRFLERNIPGSLGPELYTKTCLYDMPPDREFVLGTLPEHPQVSVVNGAGHGFKFAGLMGKILSELAIHGKTQYPIEAFRPDRPALTDPTYEPVFAM